MTKEQKLERLHNRATMYEIAAIRSWIADGKGHQHKVLVCYTAQHSRRGLMNGISAHAQHVLDVFQLPASTTMSFAGTSGEGMQIDGTGINIRFTGRTEREAIMEGEFTFIGELARVVRAA